MKREIAFLKYNKKNVFESLAFAEEHLRSKERACVVKHLIFCLGELNELISHSKRNINLYSALRDKVERLISSNRVELRELAKIRQRFWESLSLFEKIKFRFASYPYFYQAILFLFSIAFLLFAIVF